eukprot:COSAG01_NODE_1193_length_11306_cov_13.079408_9_plen_203_part_00
MVYQVLRHTATAVPASGELPAQQRRRASLGEWAHPSRVRPTHSGFFTHSWVTGMQPEISEQLCAPFAQRLIRCVQALIFSSNCSRHAEMDGEHWKVWIQSRDGDRRRSLEPTLWAARGRPSQGGERLRTQLQAPTGKAAARSGSSDRRRRRRKPHAMETDVRLQRGQREQPGASFQSQELKGNRSILRAGDPVVRWGPPQRT